MVALVLVSFKGSPGVTTAAAALAGAHSSPGRGALLAELDPAGGAIQVLASGPAAWGLVDTAGRLRRETTAAAVDEHTTELPRGIRSLLAPTAAATAHSVIASAGDRWLPGLRSAWPDVVVDAGRWEPGQRTATRIVGADLVAVACRPTVAGVETVRLGLDHLRRVARCPVAAVVVGHRPYTPGEVAAHLDVPVAGAIAWDPRAVAHLWGGGVTRRWLRSRLARSAAATLRGVEELAGPTGARREPASRSTGAARPTTGEMPPTSPASPSLPTEAPA
ncbi:MAG: hypothetical protein ACLFXM_11835 [Acidimicrobiia bacterium]